MRLDPLDVKILELLHGDARLSFREIAERVGSTTPTISARVKALEDIGVIRGYRAQLDHAVLGSLTHVVVLRVEPQRATAALAAVGALPGCRAAHLVSGASIVALVHMRGPGAGARQLHEALVGLPGLLSYEVDEVIDGVEQATLSGLPENVEVPCHQCRGPIHGEPVKARVGDRAHVFCCRQCSADFRERFERLRPPFHP